MLDVTIKSLKWNSSVNGDIFYNWVLETIKENKMLKRGMEKVLIKDYESYLADRIDFLESRCGKEDMEEYDILFNPKLEYKGGN